MYFIIIIIIMIMFYLSHPYLHSSCSFFAIRAEKLLALSVQQQNAAKATLKDHEQERS